MADTRPIPTPLAYRWRRFLQQILPVIIFACGVAMTMWLWNRQSLMGNARGVVNSRFVDVASGMAGILLPPNHGQWELFQPVKKNEVIGAVDHYEIDTFQAQLETIEKQKLKVHADFEAEKTRFLFDFRQQSQDQWFDVARQYWQVEGYLLDVKDRMTRIEVAKAELKRLQESLGFDERTYARGATAEEVVRVNRLRNIETERRIEEEEKALAKANFVLATERKRLKDTRARLAALNSEQGAELGKVIDAAAAPYLKEIDVLNAQAKEIEAQLNALVIRAPIDGFITEVFAVPGQSVQPGDPVVRIAGYDAQYIVSYIRDRQRIRPEPGTLVRVRTRFTTSRPVEARVLEVGQVVEEVPLQHRVDPVQPEWGYRVKIERPTDFPVKPGEGVDIIFPGRAEPAGELKSEPVDNRGV
jgi:multidrug resistance efflux pump